MLKFISLFKLEKIKVFLFAFKLGFKSWSWACVDGGNTLGGKVVMVGYVSKGTLSVFLSGKAGDDDEPDDEEVEDEDEESKDEFVLVS